MGVYRDREITERMSKDLLNPIEGTEPDFMKEAVRQAELREAHINELREPEVGELKDALGKMYEIIKTMRHSKVTLENDQEDFSEIIPELSDGIEYLESALNKIEPVVNILEKESANNLYT